jgi:hypothetical protein
MSTQASTFFKVMSYVRPYTIKLFKTGLKGESENSFPGVHLLS